MFTNLFAQAFIFLAAAVIAVPLAKRLGLGSALGYLLAGVIIGPWALGLVGAEGEDVMHFAEFGVIMMLFLIGLEMEPAILWKARRSILGLGGSQVVITAAVIAGLLMISGYALNASIAVGMTLALSSTAMVLQTLNEKAWDKTLPGRRSVSVLLFQDIAVIPIIALMPFLAAPGVEVQLGQDPAPNEWQHALMILGVVAAIIIGGRFLSLPVFRFIAATRSREVFIAAALILVMGVTMLMEWVGLSPALGAFLAGVVLAESEYRHELESTIEPFKGLLLGVFFIAVGSGVDIGLLIEGPLRIAALVGSLIALKFGVLLALGRLFRMAWGDNFMFSFALAQGGEFAFLLFQFATRYQVLPPDQANELILVVVLSMMMTPLLIIFYELFVRPRCEHGRVRQQDEDIEPSENGVIVAGYGRFGQVVARMLHATGVPTTLLDDDASQIAMVSRFGYKVYYGDASRVELLTAAGAANAKLIVVALDDRDKADRTTQVVKMHFPNCKVLVRAYDRRHAYHLMNLDADYIVRETFGSALMMGEEVLTLLGYPPLRAHRITRTFMEHDEKGLVELYELWGDEEAYGKRLRMTRDDLARVLADDMEEDFKLQWLPPSRPRKADNSNED